MLIILESPNKGEQTPEQIFDIFFLYLTRCSQFSSLEKSDIFQEFLEISAINHQGHKKFKECFMIKKAGGRSNESRCVRCGVFWGRWNKRYFCITSDGVSISKGRTKDRCEIREMIMFDYDFSVDYGMNDTGYSKGIRLNSSNRKLTLEAPSLFQFFDFLISLLEAKQESPYLGLHRFASFSPIRQKNFCKWYVDGEGYFKDVYKYIKKAQHEIFITDWWLSPQFYLVRPVNGEQQQSRIDLLLKKKAAEKVKIFIIVYREPKVALTIDSSYTKQTLQGLHQNIKVLRHPKTIIPYMWSHHEKMVVIDQKVGFLGGLDICYGRMDNQQHHLFDPLDDQGKGEFWPGIDFSNGRTKDYSNVKDFKRSEINRNKDPRLPWHDIAMRIVGDGVIDMTRHFIQYWNFVLADLELQKAKENKNILRSRWFEKKEDKKDDKKSDEEGFFDKIKNQWRKFRESSITREKKSQEEEQKQDIQKKFIEEQNKEYQITEDNGQVYTKKGHHSFSKQNQHDLYFNQLMKRSHLSIQKNQHTSSFQSSHFRNQNNEKAQSQNPLVIDEKSYEESKLDISTSIFKSKDDKLTLYGDKNITIGNISPSKNKQEAQQRVMFSAFPILQQQNSQQVMQQLPEVSSNKRVRKRIIFPILNRFNNYLNFFQKGSHSQDNQNIHKDCLDQQFLELLQEVRNAKDENVSLGYYESSANNLHQKDQTKQKKRKDSVDSDSSIGSINDDQEHIILDNKFAIHSKKGKAECQMVRSSSLWSCGVKDTESSIHFAYVELIAQAQHFIYIENQFFISGSAGDSVKNRVTKALVSRIKLAHQNNEQFRVIVVLPLLPGFEGELAGNAGVMKIQLYWEYQTISRGGTSIYETLENEGIPNPDKYISFYGLRTSAQKSGQDPVSEIVYVHSKLMIIDDRIVIMGSANINDRSMLGCRDSEIAMVVEDKEYVRTVMNGQPFQAGKFAYTLRQSLFQEHFGLKENELIDPIDNDLFEKIQTNSKKNTWIYREVFKCYPDDNIKTSSDYVEFSKKKNFEQYQFLKDQITGFAVEFPKKFLENENLRLKYTSKEFYCPEENFT